MEKILVRKLFVPLLALVVALNMTSFAPVTAQDSLELVCSAPAEDATVDVLPESVSITVSADVVEERTILFVADEETGARVDENGTTPEIDGATVTVDLRTEISEGVATAVEAGKTYEVLALLATDDGLTRLSFNFSVSEDAEEVGPPEGDCETEEPTEEPTEEVVEEPTDVPTEEAVVEPTEEPTEEAEPTEEPTEEVVEEPTEEPTEVVEPTEEPTEEVVEEPTEEPTEEVEPTEEPTEEVVEEPTEETVEEPGLVGEAAEYEVGDATISIASPADYVAETNDELYAIPVTVFAADAETATAYPENPDEVQQFVIIFTTFNRSSLSLFGLAEDADTTAIIESDLVRPDSELGEPETVEVGGAPAVAVSFTNPTTGKSGRFHLVEFEGGNFLLIQGSAPTGEWENYVDTYEAVIASIQPAGAE